MDMGLFVAEPEAVKGLLDENLFDYEWDSRGRLMINEDDLEGVIRLFEEYGIEFDSAG